MDRKLPALTIAVFVLLAGCAGTLQTAGTPDGNDETTTIIVSGTGEATADADLALLRVSVVATAETADAARTQVAADVERMRAALRDAGIADTAVTTAGYRLSPRYDHQKRTRAVVGYHAIHAFRVEVAPDHAGEVIDVAIGNGASRVDGVQFTLSDEARADLRAQALASAVDAARADVDAIAAQTQRTITGVESVETTGGYRPVSYAESGRTTEMDTTLSPGPVTVTTTVRVVYAAS